MLLNFHIGDKVLFKDYKKGNVAHFYPWARKSLRPGIALTIRSVPSNNGFCMATDPDGNLIHINVITDGLQILTKPNRFP